MDLFVPGGVDQPQHVARQLVDVVGAHTGWLAAQVVTTLVGRPDAVAGRGQRGDLLRPAAPVFGKAVQQDQRRPIGRAGLSDVEGDTVGWNSGVMNLSAQGVGSFQRAPV